MTNKIKLFGVFVLLLVGALMLSGVAAATPASITKVEVDRTDMTTPGKVLNLERGTDIEVYVEMNSGDQEICVNGDEELCRVQVEALVRGYDHNDLIEDITDVFKMDEAGKTYTKVLKLHIPQRIDIDPSDDYAIAVFATGSKGIISTIQANVELDVAAESHLIAIKDTVLNPERDVQAGRALLASVRVKNYGYTAEDGVKVIVSIPELGVSASDYIDEIKAGESTTSEELYMRLPECASAGTYRVDVVVEYDDGDEEVKDYTTINVVNGDTCSPLVPSMPPSSGTAKTLINIGADSQNVAQGTGGVVYPVTITNAGVAARTYTVSADGADWASFRVSPTSTVLLQSGEAASVFVYVSANADAPVGQQMFAITVSSQGQILKQVPLRANVQAGSTVGVIGLKKGLEIGLIVLVILLVILGLVIGFNKLRAEPDEEGKTYY